MRKYRYDLETAPRPPIGWRPKALIGTEATTTNTTQGQDAPRREDDNTLFSKWKVYNRVAGDSDYFKGFPANDGVIRSLYQYFNNDDNYVQSRLNYIDELYKVGIIDKFRRDNLFAHEDLKDVYLNMPQRNNTVEESQYKPTLGDKNTKYYRSKIFDADKNKEAVVDALNNLKTKTTDRNSFGYSTHPKAHLKEIVNDNMGVAKHPTLSDYTISRGFDPKRGEYAGIYDKWDFNTDFINTPGDNVGKWIGGTPKEIYDRLYLDDYYGADSSASKGTYYGGYTPEVVIIGNRNKRGKRLLGGYNSLLKYSRLK